VCPQPCRGGQGSAEGQELPTLPNSLGYILGGWRIVSGNILNSIIEVG